MSEIKPRMKGKKLIAGISIQAEQYDLTSNLLSAKEVSAETS